jgi:hypothetical protein
MKRILLGVLVLGMMGMSQAAITYMDADFTAGTGNTLFAPSAGGGTITTTTTDTVDGFWRYRTGLGLKPTDTVIPSSPIVLTGGTVYESTGNNQAGTPLASDNVPRVVTTVGGLSLGTYDVYVYYWGDASNSPWRIRAGLADIVDPLPLFITGTGTPAPIQVGTDTTGRKLWQASLGQVTGTSISVFVEDGPATNSTQRTWYDGIGYSVPEPATMVILGLGALVMRRKR